MAKTPGRPGRKPRPAKQGQRVSLGLKVTPEIKNWLDAEAKRNGRTQSQEAEARLENSFRNERVFDEAIDLVFGPIDGDLLISVFGEIMKAASRTSNLLSDFVHWIDNPAACKAMVVFIMKPLLDALERKRTVNDIGVSLSGQFIRREILRVMNNEEWLQLRRQRLDFRAVLIENWIKELQRQYDTTTGHDEWLKRSTSHITNLDDANQPTTKEEKK